MSSGFLAPDPRLRELSDLGLVQAGAKLNTYVAGTATPLATYSDLALTTPNANPVVASAGGLFGPVYLTPGTAYKFVLTDALGNALWTQDNITTPNVLAAGTGISLTTVAGVTTIAAASTVGTQNFRLTLTTGVPITSADVTAATTLYASPYGGNRIDLYDAAGVPTTLSSAEFSIAVPATTSQMYDVFAFNNGGVATLELLAWTNDTTRATAIVRTTTGTYTKSGDLTRRYLGSFRTTTVSGQTEDSATKRYVWNYYNRDRRPLRVTDVTNFWTYTIATFRQARASAANQVDVVVGVAESTMQLVVQELVTNDTGTVNAYAAIGEDSTTTMVAGMMSGVAVIIGANAYATMTGTLVRKPAIGRHFYAWLEYSIASGVTTWYGAPVSGVGGPFGLVGWIEG